MKGFVAEGPNEKAGTCAVLDVGVWPKVNPPADAGRPSSFVCPKLKDVLIGGAIGAEVKLPKGLESCGFFTENGVEDGAAPKENGLAEDEDTLVAPKREPLLRIGPVPKEKGWASFSLVLPFICISLVGLSSILTSCSIALGGVAGRSGTGDDAG